MCSHCRRAEIPVYLRIGEDGAETCIGTVRAANKADAALGAAELLTMFARQLVDRVPVWVLPMSRKGGRR